MCGFTFTDHVFSIARDAVGTNIYSLSITNTLAGLLAHAPMRLDTEYTRNEKPTGRDGFD
jgi:hypothetical protein